MWEENGKGTRATKEIKKRVMLTWCLLNAHVKQPKKSNFTLENVTHLLTFSLLYFYGGPRRGNWSSLFFVSLH